jgi:hypothetical protein
MISEEEFDNWVAAMNIAGGAVFDYKTHLENLNEIIKMAENAKVGEIISAE